MSKKLLQLNYMDDIAEDMSFLDYVISPDDDDSPYGCLLWIDLRNAEHKAGFTARQRLVFELWASGIPVQDIAVKLKLNRPTLHRTITKLQERIGLQELGLITATVEGVGWEGAKEILTKVAEEMGLLEKKRRK